MSLSTKILFLLLCFIHLALLFAFALPFFIAIPLALVPAILMKRSVFRETPNILAMRGMCGMFILLDLFMAASGYSAIQANAASAAKGGGLMGGFGEWIIAASVVLGLSSAACFFLMKLPPSASNSEKN